MRRRERKYWRRQHPNGFSQWPPPPLRSALVSILFYASTFRRSGRFGASRPRGASALVCTGLVWSGPVQCARCGAAKQPKRPVHFSAHCLPLARPSVRLFVRPSVRLSVRSAGKLHLTCRWNARSLSGCMRASARPKPRAASHSAGHLNLLQMHWRHQHHWPPPPPPPPAQRPESGAPSDGTVGGASVLLLLLLCAQGLGWQKASVASCRCSDFVSESAPKQTGSLAP